MSQQMTRRVLSVLVTSVLAFGGCGTEQEPPEPQPAQSIEQPQESELANPCDSTGPWTSVLYQLPGKPAEIDRLTFVDSGADQYTINSSWGDSSESATLNDCTFTTNDDEYRYEIAPDGSVSLFDVDGFIRMYARE